MKRNVILMGGKTYVISLPADWVRQNGIKKGQELEVQQDIGKVTIMPCQREQARKTITIDSIGGLNGKMVKAYQLGYDEIKMTGKLNIDEIQTTINSLMHGFEIISSSRSLCIASVVSELSPTEIDPLLRRAFLLMPSRESNVTALRLISMCKRCLSKNGYKNFNASLLTYNLLCDMEKAVNNKQMNSKIIDDIYSRFSTISYEDIAIIQKQAGDASMLVTDAMQEIAISHTA